MNENVGTIFLLDKTKSLRFVEKFDGTGSYVSHKNKTSNQKERKTQLAG
jgi:hypothetical protein